MSKYSHHPSQEYLDYLQALEGGPSEASQRLIAKAARLGDPLALHTLGYEAEVSDPPNIEQSLRYYRRAARAGYEPSMVNLARHYEAARNYRRYFHWLTKSADLGSEESRKELRSPFPYLLLEANRLRESGDEDRATELYAFCARHGSAEGAVNLANMIDLRGRRSDASRVRKLYQVGIDAGLGVAAYNMALHYKALDDIKNCRFYTNLAKCMGYAPL